MVNATSTAIDLKKIEFEAAPHIHIGGTFSIDFRNEGILKPQNSSNIISLNLSRPYTIQPQAEYTAHIIMPPFTIAAGENFKVRIFISQGQSEKSLSPKTDAISFRAGSINKTTIRSSGFEKGRTIFAKGVTKQSGWYDVNKKGDATTLYGDALMC